MAKKSTTISEEIIETTEETVVESPVIDTPVVEEVKVTLNGLKPEVTQVGHATRAFRS